MFYLLALLGFAFVIFIHELGHFVFAKMAGVRVERFSIGMGPIVWSRQIGETQYALSLLPVGGYVKMLGQEDVPGRAVDDLSERSYLAKSAPWKAAILFGGVLFNLISSWLILVLLAFWGAPVIEPVVGDVERESQGPKGKLYETPAWVMGLRAGDRILSVNGQEVRGFQDVMMAGLANANQPVTMRVEREGELLELPRDPAAAIAPVPNGFHGRPVLGIQRPRGLRLIQVARVPGDEPREEDPQPGERLLGCVDTGQSFAGWTGQMVDEHLLPFVGREVTLRLGRGGEERRSTFRYAGNDRGSLLAGIGLPVLLSAVTEGGPADLAGLRPGMLVTHVDGQPLAGTRHFQALVRRAAAEGRGVQLRTWQLGDDGRWVAGGAMVTASLDERLGRVLIGVHLGMVQGGVLPVLPPALGHDTSPLAAAGMQPGDAIVDIDQRPDGLRVLVLPQAGQRMLSMPEEAWRHMAHVPRQSLIGRLGSGLFGIPVPRSIWRQLTGTQVERVDPAAAELLVRGVDREGRPGSPRLVSLRRLDLAAQEAMLQLQTGDWICASPGADADGDPALVVVRSTAEHAAPRWVSVTYQDPGLVLQTMLEQVPYRLEHWSEAFAYANDSAVNMVVITLKLIPRFFASAEEGGIDASKSLQGPIGIFNELSVRLQHMGFASFLHLLALIGLNLFLINLLPIPIVDGGQLLFLGIESIIRRPVPMKIQDILNWMGLGLIVFLMLFVIGNDIARLL